MKTIGRVFKDPKQHYFLFGPRGTGKTWWTGEMYPEALRIDLLRADVLRDLQAKPERLIERVEGALDSKVIVIDEVQKVPELLNAVHLLIEKHKEIQFVLTGSSARKLRKKGVNLLGGRALNKSMHPYMGTELKGEFILEKALKKGMLPLVWAAGDAEATLHAYVTSYIQEEVQMEGLVRDIGSFNRFLEAISFSQGAAMNISSIARESEAGRKAVEGYIEILEDLLIGFKLNAFRKKAQREAASHPKFYYFDCGVFRAIRPTGPLDRVEEIEGIALETLVAQQLRAWCSYSKGGHELYYWRSASKLEVDFVIYGESGVYGVEVKNSKKIKTEHFRGLKSFGAEYPMAKKCLIYRGEYRQKVDDILCIPAEEFLRELEPNEPLF